MTLAQYGLNLAETLINLSGNEELQTILEMMDLIEELFAEFNISTEQISDIIDSLISTSLVYSSQSHPASVTVPFTATDSEGEDYITYYLHSDTSMDTISPSTTEGATISVLGDTGIWNGPVLTRNKIISDVSAFIYIEHTDYRILQGPLTVTASLISGGTSIATSSQTLEKTKSFSSSLNAYRFTFENLSSTTELLYGTKLGLQITVAGFTNDSSAFGRSVIIQYDSSQYPSFLSFKQTETDHLTVSGSSDPIDGKILPGAKVIYNLEISSELDDTVGISIRSSSFSVDEQDQY